MSAISNTTTPAKLKDEVLFERGARYNVAQFASFNTDLELRFSRIKDIDTPADFEAAVRAVFEKSGEKSVNVRTFEPGNPQTTAFAYGLKSTEDAIAKVREFAAQGLYTIVNETIDVNDGGVSGVYHRDRVEFSPNATPRCVEKPGCCALTRELARKIFTLVYGFTPAFDDAPEIRIEFSLHPLPRGTRSEHIIVWEAGIDEGDVPTPEPRWPNNFSRHVGDKAFGLMIAHLSGLPVPATTIISRRLAPVSFGQKTGSAAIWTRTCPNEQTPGLFTTCRGWTDPFALLAKEDPEGKAIGAVLAQAEVSATWSGACITTSDGKIIIEGVPGFGDGFMQGDDLPEGVDPTIEKDVLALYAQAASILGPVRFEWVHDGKKAWIVQLHAGKSRSREDWIVEGTAETWHDFPAEQGLDALRALVGTLNPAKDGLHIIGRIGFTSHIADVIRKAGITARVIAPETAKAA